MSIASDRQALTSAVRDALPGWTVTAHAPLEPSGKSCWIELQHIARGDTFGTLTLTWKVTAAIQANATPAVIVAALDAAADAILAANQAAGAADLEDAPAYFALSTSSGAAFPAVEFTFTSSTNIKE